MSSIKSTAWVTLAQVKSLLDISGSTEDEKLTLLINSATDTIETFLKRHVKKASYENIKIDIEEQRYLMLKDFPVDSGETVSLQYRTDINSWSTLDSDLYDVDYDTGIIRIFDNSFWAIKPIEFRASYTAGWDDDEIPSDLILAVSKIVDNARNSVGNIKSETLGDHRVDYNVPDLLDEGTMDILFQYKRIDV